MHYYFVNHNPCETAHTMGATEISKERYEALIDNISHHSDPAPDGKYWQLEVNGEWTLHDLPPIPNDPTPPTEAERLEALESQLAGIVSAYREGVNEA